MIDRLRHNLIATTLLLTMCLAAKAQFDSAPAFPGAEGHGRYVCGGRGGKVVHVTQLGDNGPGSLREAVTGTEKKIVVFDVAGVIALERGLRIGENTTILGQTAPRPGITIRYFTVEPSSNNIIRYVRFRRGSERSVSDGADAASCAHAKGIILDHCSFSWSIDEVASFYDNNNFTMQWCTIGEALNNAGHGKGAHGYGGIWGGKLASFHHNLLIHLNNRVPRFNGARYNWKGYADNDLYAIYGWKNALQAENVDFRNCVMFNWGTGKCYGGTGGGQINIVGNYYKAGPATTDKTCVTKVSEADASNGGHDLTFRGMSSRYFIQDNFVEAVGGVHLADNSRIDDNPNGMKYDWKGVRYDNEHYALEGEVYTPDPHYYYNGEGLEHAIIDSIPCVRIRMDEPAPTGYITTHSASYAYNKVLAFAGASYYRDTVDARYVKETQCGMPTFVGTVTGQPGIIDVVADVDGYTEKTFPTGSHPKGFDTDGDGMPDDWETRHGLNPKDASDATSTSLDKRGFYTNIEVYANSLVEDITRRERSDAQSSFEEYYPLVEQVIK